MVCYLFTPNENFSASFLPSVTHITSTQLQLLTTLSQSKAFKLHTPSLQLPLVVTLLQQTEIQETQTTCILQPINQTTP